MFDRDLHAGVEKVLSWQFARAKQFVEGHWREVERIAAAVLAKMAFSAGGEELIVPQPRLKLVERRPDTA
jgi:hypothetical protein